MIVGEQCGQERIVRDRADPWLVAEDSELLVRPLHFSAVDVPIPAAQMCESLRNDEVTSLFLQLSFGPFLLGHIPSDAGDADGPTIGMFQRRAGPVIGNEAVIFGEQLTVKFGLPFREGLLNGVGGTGLIFQRHEGQGRLVQHFLWAVSRNVPETPIPFRQVALGVESEHDIRDRLHDIV